MENTKRILLIDDVRENSYLVSSKGLEPATHIARTYDEGLRLLKEGNWDELYLDHDLADTQVPERTGYTLLCFIEEFPQYLPKAITLVTANPVGRYKMQSLIDALYLCYRGDNG